MKILLPLLCSFTLAAAAFAQAPVAQSDAQPFTSDELDQLVGPIALYPDPLIGLILPASTVPSDIVVADRYMDANGDPAQIVNQPWDDSVKGLTHYPDLLKWLDQNLAWTTQLGQAYLAQPADVMNSIQQLRARAKADGTLVNNDQQQLGLDNDGDITITPTSADTIYMPQYDPDAVYDDQYSPDDGSLITYDSGYPMGPWCYYWPDWHHHGIFLDDWRLWRHYQGGEGFAGDPGARRWSPNPDRVRTAYVVRSFNQARPGIATTQPLPGVTIVHGKHYSSPLGVTGVRTGGLTTGGLSISGVRAGGLPPPQADFTGRGDASTPQRSVDRPVVVEPQGQAPQETAVTGYGRGSDARAASERGEVSREGNGPVVNRPAGEPAYRPPAEPAYRPPAEPAYRPPPEPAYRPAPAPAPAPVFQSMGSGAGASSAGERGAESRNGR